MGERDEDVFVDTERPREVYLAACASIAESLQSAGFKYAASRQHSRRKVGDFVF